MANNQVDNFSNLLKSYYGMVYGMIEVYYKSTDQTAVFHSIVTESQQ